jgi:hypothetical protein
MSFATGKVAAARRAAKAARPKNAVPKRLGISQEAKDTAPIRDRQHMGRVAGQRCLMCQLAHPQVHHIREALPRTMGVKVGDDMTVPVCPTHHMEIHATNNMAAWDRYGIDPLAWAKAFYAETLRLRGTL